MAVSGREPVSERLSAAGTPITKFVAPIFTAGILAYVVGQMQRHPERFDWFGKPLPWWAPWIAALIGLATAAFLGIFVAPLKRVALEGDVLVISNYRRSVRVPLSAIAELGYLKHVQVDERPLIAIRLLEPTVFGQEILFMPTDEHVLTKLERCRQLAQQTLRPGT